MNGKSRRRSASVGRSLNTAGDSVTSSSLVSVCLGLGSNPGLALPELNWGAERPVSCRLSGLCAVVTDSGEGEWSCKPGLDDSGGSDSCSSSNMISVLRCNIGNVRSLEKRLPNCIALSGASCSCQTPLI